MDLDTARRALEALLAANDRLASEAARAAKAEARANLVLRHLSAELSRTRDLARTQQSELAEARDTVTRLQTLTNEQIEIIRGLRAAIRNEIAARANT